MLHARIANHDRPLTKRRAYCVVEKKNVIKIIINYCVQHYGAAAADYWLSFNRLTSAYLTECISRSFSTVAEGPKVWLDFYQSPYYCVTVKHVTNFKTGASSSLLENMKYMITIVLYLLSICYLCNIISPFLVLWTYLIFLLCPN